MVVYTNDSCHMIKDGNSKENLLINILLKGVWEVVNQKISGQL